MNEQTCGTCLYREIHGLNKRAEDNGWPVTISCYCEIINAHVNSYDKACPAYEYGDPQMFYDDMDDF